MSSPAPRRLALALIWTAALGAGLYAADRFLLGTRQTGWQLAAAIEDIPADAGLVPTPRFVPEHLGWPPRVILYRSGPVSGCWLGLAGPGDTEPQVWIGRGDDPLPDPVIPFAGCMASPRRDCPAGWRTLSVAAGDRPTFLLGTAPPGEMRRIMKGLEDHKKRVKSVK
ncbi:MAG: hypothetical protein CVU56_05545 [Deltaproteobacteria bacterium HGW-Deltaproteobacteria-14]|jgi:hypothetical protein|nr:MAG: hypothetical protein CVU56_05545 [Deltaproteobacteria bacterium HGW-Deltaproteobacteria-14]